MNDRQMIPFERLQPSPLNPRKTFDEEGLKDLSAAIERDGVLQNLVARPHADDPGAFEIIAGERRWRAVRILVETGTWDATAELPVKVHPCSDLELLKLATIENVQRANLPPLEEAGAYHALVERGVPTDVIADHVGVSRRHVQLRLQLVDNLVEEAKQALRDGEIELARCRVLAALASPERQRSALPMILKGHWNYKTAEDLKDALQAEAIPKSFAIFDPKLYDGPIHFDPDDESEEYFADVDLFHKLQRKAAEDKCRELSEVYSWVQITNDHVRTWEYEHCDDPKRAGCIIQLDGDGEVTIHKDLLKPQEAPSPGRGSSKPGKPDAAPGPEAFLPNQAGLVQAKVEKTRALRKAVVEGGASPAMILVIMALAEVASPYSEVKIKNDHPTGHDRIDDPATAMALNPHRKLFGGFGRWNAEAAKKAYAALREMPKAEIQALFTAVVARTLGTYPGYRADLGDPEWIVTLAEDLGADVAGAWSVDEAYLKACTRRPLMELAADLQLIGGEITREQAEKMRVSDLRQHVLEYLDRNPEKKVVVPRAFKFGTEKQLMAMAPKAATKPKPAAKSSKPAKVGAKKGEAA